MHEHFLETVRRLVRGDRSGVQVSLYELAVHRFDLRKLLGRFHALGNHRDVQIMGQQQDHPDNLLVLTVLAHVLDKGTVDLEPVDRQPVQIAER